MPWFKVDDQLAVHVKAISAGNAAMGLWVRAGSWCAAQLTDGFIPDAAVLALGATPKDARSLADAGLWHPAEGGWQFHDWAEYQPTREQVLAEREATRERVSKHRAKRSGNAVTNGVGTTTPSPSPDLTKTSPRQSSSDRGSVSTDAEVSPMTRRLAGLAGITSLQSVINSARKHAHRDIDPDGAYRLGAHLLAKAPRAVSNPQMYVTRSISLSPFEVQQFIDEQGLAVAS